MGSRVSTCLTYQTVKTYNHNTENDGICIRQMGKGIREVHDACRCGNLVRYEERNGNLILLVGKRVDSGKEGRKEG